MEEKRHHRQPPLKVEREFAGSRLEQPILMRVYELAVPVICRRTDAVPLPDTSDRLVSDSFLSQSLAKGA
jgi:hypothetical protein